jgi:hypothetical protein
MREERSHFEYVGSHLRGATYMSTTTDELFIDMIRASSAQKSSDDLFCGEDLSPSVS